MADAAPRRPQYGFLACAFVVVALFVLLRVPALDAGPGYDNPDELIYVPKSIKYGAGDLNPHWFDNPPLASYLMFGGQIVRYAVGRATGRFANAVDFRDQYLFVDGGPAFLTARIVVLLAAVACVCLVMAFARRLAAAFTDAPAAPPFAAIVAGLGLAASPLHIERSAFATNDVMVALASLATVVAAVRLLEGPTMRRALIAGAASGLAAGTKYTGVLASVPVAVACLAAFEEPLGARTRRLLAAAAACIVAFLVVCPWAALTPAEFKTSAYMQVFETQTRSVADAGFYPRAAWEVALGPVWCVLAAVAGVWTIACCVRAPKARTTRVRLVLLAAVLVPPALLMLRPSLAMQRHLLPVVPAWFAWVAAEWCAFPGKGAMVFRAVAVSAAAEWFVVGLMALPQRFEEAAKPRTQDLVAAWLREHAEDGAYVVTGPAPPWVARWEDRESDRDELPAETVARMTPAFRLRPAYVHFAGKLQRVTEAGALADDWPAIARAGPAYAVTSSEAARIFDKLPPGEYPGRGWYASVEKSLRLLHEFGGEAVRGPTIRVWAVDPR